MKAKTTYTIEAPGLKKPLTATDPGKGALKAFMKVLKLTSTLGMRLKDQTLDAEGKVTTYLFEYGSEKLTVTATLQA